MGQIPEDATHWDSGDWIEWHRASPSVNDRPCEATAQDPLARLTAMHVSLLRACKAYFEMTGEHLPVYRTIAQVHAAIHFDLPLEGPRRSCTASGTEILHIPPHGPHNSVDVDMADPFSTLIVVRIKDDFTTEARMIARADLPEQADGIHRLSWQALPQTF